VNVISWVQNTIERATYPTILKGEAPSGVRAGYPIAILSTQAKVKFASPSDALMAMLEDLAYNTLLVVKNRIDAPVSVIDNYKIMPDDYDKYSGRIKVKLDPSLPTDVAASIPKVELAVGSLGLPKEVGLKELGYEDPLELRDLRLAEDLSEDPRVREVMAEHFIKFLAPEYAQALEQQMNTNEQMQKMQENIQNLQGQLQQLTMTMQVKQAQAQLDQTDQQIANPNPAPSMAPGQTSPLLAAPPGQQGGARPGAGGSPMFGQNPSNPNNMGQGMAVANPDTAMANIARELRAQQSITSIGSQQQAYGSDLGAEL
jgi:hypothetical protein